MEQYAKYLFQRTMPKGRFIMREHTGFSIPNFPATYFYPKELQSGKGVKYIALKEIQYENQLTLSLWFKDFICSTLNFIPELPNLCYGNFKNDAMLIQFRDGTNWGSTFERCWLHIWFFKEMEDYSANLYHRWISGELILKDEIDEYIRLHCNKLPRRLRGKIK